MLSRTPPCCCGPGRLGWDLRPGDRFCSLCGRRLVVVRPRGPVLVPDPAPELAAYLQPDCAGGLTGCLELDISAPGLVAPRLRWTPLDGLASRLERAETPEPG